MKKVLLVDDSPEIIKSLALIINEIKGLQIVASVSNGLNAIRAFNLYEPDIVLLDISLTNSNGIEVLSDLKSSAKPPIVIMFTNYSRESFRKTSIKLGADYFLDKTNDTDKLIDILTHLAKS